MVTWQTFFSLYIFIVINNHSFISLSLNFLHYSTTLTALQRALTNHIKKYSITEKGKSMMLSRKGICKHQTYSMWGDVSNILTVHSRRQCIIVCGVVRHIPGIRTKVESTAPSQLALREERQHQMFTNDHTDKQTDIRTRAATAAAYRIRWPRRWWCRRGRHGSPSSLTSTAADSYSRERKSAALTCIHSFVRWLILVPRYHVAAANSRMHRLQGRHIRYVR